MAETSGETPKPNGEGQQSQGEGQNLQNEGQIPERPSESGQTPSRDEIADTVRHVLGEQLGRRRSASGFRREEEFESPTREIIEKLVDLNKKGQTTGDQWDEAKTALDQLFVGAETQLSTENPSYKQVYFVSKAIRRALADYKDQIPEELKTRLEQFTGGEGPLIKLNRQFQQKYQDMKKTDQDELVGDIEREATSYYKQIVSGFGIRIHDAKEELLDMIGDDPTGIREWRAVSLTEGFDNAVRVNQLFEVPVIWEEIPEKIGQIYSFVESTDLSVEEMGSTVQQAINMIRNIAPDTPEGRSVREKLVKDLDAFRAFHSMRITLERQDMNPKEMLGVFQNYFDDETWMTFARRFGSDSRGRAFVDTNNQELNPFDVSFEFYSAKLRDERILMNMVEAMTKHSIGGKLTGGALSAVKEYCDFANLPKEWQAKFEDELENLRQYFATKLDDAGESASEWGRKNSKAMKDTIQNWHTKKTLQGAFWRVEKDDIDDLAEEFGITEQEAEKRFLGREFLAVRRQQLRDELEQRLQSSGLKTKDGKPADFADLKQSGFLESVDYNSYYLTWMFEWSNYDSIRIFNKEQESHLDDDFDDIVVHQNTNMFWGRHTDHMWEFFHDTNENRGRAKENDVNRIWKQHLPGKHHYIFPQNSLMVRWAEHFMTDEQKATVEARTRELMGKWDFDNEKYHDEFVGWMRSAAVMDMIENGEFTFGQGENKFSSVANKLRKFEMVDVYIDRNKHLEYASPEFFQDYLADPTEAKFAEINDKEKVFYSTRAARQFPWMTLALRAHWEIANHHSMRLFDKPNLPSASMENMVKGLVEEGHAEKQQGNDFKRRYLTLLKSLPCCFSA